MNENKSVVGSFTHKPECFIYFVYIQFHPNMKPSFLSFIFYFVVVITNALHMIVENIKLYINSTH